MPNNQTEALLRLIVEAQRQTTETIAGQMAINKSTNDALERIVVLLEGIMARLDAMQSPTRAPADDG